MTSGQEQPCSSSERGCKEGPYRHEYTWAHTHTKTHTINAQVSVTGLQFNWTLLWNPVRVPQPDHRCGSAIFCPATQRTRLGQPHSSLQQYIANRPCSNSHSIYFYLPPCFSSLAPFRPLGSLRTTSELASFLLVKVTGSCISNLQNVNRIVWITSRQRTV